MKYLEIQYVNWEQTYWIPCELSEKLDINDRVVVHFSWGDELTRIINISAVKKDKDEEVGEILRKATTDDLKKLNDLDTDNREALEYCHDLAKKLGLKMKLVDAHFSFDKKRLVFAFIAQGRVDFRELIKEITKKFRGNIRLQQIGVRDEARISGDIGSCGFRLCCQTHLRNLGNISSEMVNNQKISPRGLERLSGACGRLKCCLAYEQANYDKK